MNRLTRRQSLRLMGGAAGTLAGWPAAAPLAAGFPGATLPQELPQAKHASVGAHLWVYAAKQPRYDPTPVLDQVFREVSGAGLDCLELMHQALLHDDSVERISELAQRFKLPVIGTSWSAAMWRREEHGAILNEARVLIPRLASLKGRTLGLTVGDARRPKTGQELDAQAEVLREIMAICRDHGVVPNLHNHTYEVADGEHDLRGTLERIPDIQLGPDLDWLFRAGVDPVDFIRRHRARIVFLHLRNRKADGTWPEDMAEGVIDYAAIGAVLREIAFAGDMMIELAHERDFVPTRSIQESLRISRNYLRRIMKH
jgi:sugar phosphate isomerase/epimerase